MMPRVRFEKNVCSDLSLSLDREWLETNGLGGFAASTVAGANTRRYHGLLVAAVPSAGETTPGRQVLLSKIEETLLVGGQRFELSTNLYPGVIHPAGYRFLTEFRLDPFPVFTFDVGGVKIEKRLFLVDGENTLVLEYEAWGQECSIELRPLVAFRGYHELRQSQAALDQGWDGGFTDAAGCITIQPREGLPPLHFAHTAKRITREGNYWYFNFEYPIERERGFDFLEDLYCPFALEYGLAPGQPATLIVSTEAGHRAEEGGGLRAGEIARREGLSAAADQFIARRGSKPMILAGYPWFGEWYRDTMISLPGLTLVAERYDVARGILEACVESLNHGMLPNRFPEDGGAVEYNTVDATLWLFEAVRKYLEYTGDTAFVRGKVYEPLKSVIDWYARGTRFGIAMELSGLLRAGDATTQLTWMDARVEGQPVTPRHGKAVEIQALWYNALRVMAKLAGDIGDAAAAGQYGGMADLTGASFARTFWNDGAGCLFDVVEGDQRDASIRPNQAIALSLGYCAIESQRAVSVLRVVEEKLLTPFGLRTLAPEDPRYCGRYEGGPAQRDGAYHQGTVWPWLLGPYLMAEAKFNGEQGRVKAAKILSSLRDFVKARGTGQMPEIFDGDAPHEPRGCFAQAWSVAELERAAAECSIAAWSSEETPG